MANPRPPTPKNNNNKKWFVINVRSDEKPAKRPAVVADWQSCISELGWSTADISRLILYAADQNDAACGNLMRSSEKEGFFCNWLGTDSSVS